MYFWIRRWEEAGTLDSHHRQHYERATTAEEDVAIVASHSADPFLSTRTTSSNYSVSIFYYTKPNVYDYLLVEIVSSAENIRSLIFNTLLQHVNEKAQSLRHPKLILNLIYADYLRRH